MPGRGALLDLNQFIPDIIDISAWDEGHQNLGLIDGVMAGLTIGVDSYAIIFDEEVIAGAGMEMPEQMNWEEFATFANDVFAALGDGHVRHGRRRRRLRGLRNLSPAARQAPLYRGRDSLGFDRDDLIEWFTYWEALRQSGAATPADITAANLTPETSPIVMGQSPIEWTTASQFVNFQGLQPHELGLRMYPAGPEGSEPGQFIRPALFISASADDGIPE